MTDYKCDEVRRADDEALGPQRLVPRVLHVPEVQGHDAATARDEVPEVQAGEIIEVRASGRGRAFYGCSNYSSEQKCDFRVWQKPIFEKCPQCGADFLVRAGGKKAPIIKCANETCGYERDRIYGEPCGGDDEELSRRDGRRGQVAAE